jgi:hypothetical protein
MDLNPRVYLVTAGKRSSTVTKVRCRFSPTLSAHLAFLVVQRELNIYGISVVLFSENVRFLILISGQYFEWYLETGSSSVDLRVSYRVSQLYRLVCGCPHFAHVVRNRKVQMMKHTLLKKCLFRFSLKLLQLHLHFFHTHVISFRSILDKSQPFRTQSKLLLFSSSCRLLRRHLENQNA